MDNCIQTQTVFDIIDDEFNIADSLLELTQIAYECESFIEHLNLGLMSESYYYLRENGEEATSEQRSFKNMIDAVVEFLSKVKDSLKKWFTKVSAIMKMNLSDNTKFLKKYDLDKLAPHSYT